MFCGIMLQMDETSTDNSEIYKNWAIQTVTPFLQKDLNESTSAVSDGEALQRFERIVKDLIGITNGL